MYWKLLTNYIITTVILSIQLKLMLIVGIALLKIYHKMFVTIIQFSIKNQILNIIIRYVNVSFNDYYVLLPIDF